METEEPKNLVGWARAVLAALKRVVTHPRSELNRWERRARFAYDLGRYGARKLRRDAAPQMAAALSYRTLFSFLPVLVVGTLVVRAIGGVGLFRDKIASYLTTLRLDDIRLQDTGEGAEPGTSMSLSGWILGLLDEAEKIDLTAITWVGAAVLVYSAVSLMVTIETSFNAIYGAPGGRAWGRRLPVYWTLLTLGPIAIAATVVLSNQVDTFLADHTGFLGRLDFLSSLLAFLGTWLVMFIAYKWLPNTHVRVQPALIGALVAALLLEGGKALLSVYVGNALSVRHLYGSLGLVPLFMFWVYVMWLLVLFGVEVSAALHRFSGGVIEAEEEAKASHRIADPGAIVAIMEIVARRFTRGETTHTADVVERLALEELTAELMLRALVDARILHRIDDEGVYTPARPLDQIALDDLLDVGFSLAGDTAAARVPLLERLRGAQREVASSITLSTLVAETPRQTAP